MFRRILILPIAALILSSCGGAAPTITEEPVVIESPTQSFLAENTPTLEPAQTFTPEPTSTPTVVPTETPLPPLKLPTEIPNAPALLPWDGTPTYLGDSQPGFAFRVMYDPDVWALTEDQFGYPALGHRGIPYCVISVTAGRGLPANVSVEQDILYADKLTFYVGTAFENGVRKFVTYTGGDGTIVTAFEVSFQEQADECLADATTVVTTLRSVPVSQATPQP
ncbi:hypothetical protein FBQ81_08420 [Chloroflexi bacterium CFX6]|nr:hypothetical protein [Chloroflexi bacterium CFX6]